MNDMSLTEDRVITSTKTKTCSTTSRGSPSPSPTPGSPHEKRAALPKDCCKPTPSASLCRILMSHTACYLTATDFRKPDATTRTTVTVVTSTQTVIVGGPQTVLTTSTTTVQGPKTTLKPSTVYSNFWSYITVTKTSTTTKIQATSVTSAKTETVVSTTTSTSTFYKTQIAC